VLTALGIVPAAWHLRYLIGLPELGQAPPGLPSTSTREVVTTDFLLVWLLLALCSLVGCFLSQRYQLAGLGTWQQLREAAPVVIVGGFALGAASYLVFGRRLAEVAPGLYPDAIGRALLMALKGALVEETVARFGMMTILAGMVRRPWLANILQAAFFTAISVKALAFFGVEVDGFVKASMAAGFALHLVLGAVYARWGLIPAALMHLVADLKFAVHAVIT
jgi:hypothetical protein